MGSLALSRLFYNRFWRRLIHCMKLKLSYKQRDAIIRECSWLLPHISYIVCLERIHCRFFCDQKVPIFLLLYCKLCILPLFLSILGRAIQLLRKLAFLYNLHSCTWMWDSSKFSSCFEGKVHLTRYLRTQMDIAVDSCTTSATHQNSSYKMVSCTFCML